MLYNYVQDTQHNDDPTEEELHDREKLDNHLIKLIKKDKMHINDKMTRSCRAGLVRGAVTGCITGGMLGGVAGGALFGIINPLMIYIGEE
jgi:hypothetical protein